MTSIQEAPASSATGIIGWEHTDEQWLAAREGGISASDVAVLLGFSPYQTPAQLWAQKTGRPFPPIVVNEAMQLGLDLEPWLLERSARHLGPVTRTPSRLYAHPEYPWRMASPDGMIVGTTDLVEAKTAGLTSGFGIPLGWSEETIPLGYNFQARWQMHVLDAPRVHVPALVAGLGFRLYTLERDLVIEADMVAQVTEWYERHILGDVEPPLGAGDLEALGLRYPNPTAGAVELDDTDAHDLWIAYRAAHEREKRAGADKTAAGAGLKLLLREHDAGTVEGQVICTWKARDGAVDWKRLAVDLADTAAVPLPDPETYRKPSTRTFLLKDTA